jgi:hypothetical protein
MAWWLLVFCVVLDAALAAMNLLMLNMDGSMGFGPTELIWDMGALALATGLCAIAAGLWLSGRDRSWLLMVHGAALAGFGSIGISPLVRGPLSFRPISLLFVTAAMSLGVFALTSQWQSEIQRWFLRVSGVLSLVYGISFVAVGFGVVRLEPPRAYWIWMSCYFALCAALMIGLAAQRKAQNSRESAAMPPLPTPRPAH